ncbi:MAG: FAD-binding protein, partial [Muribaculaceae bacterium]|nr:FAD-binding protein [Muribaculaceae bacterium]
PVDLRAVDMARIARQGIVDPDSNYCFGEGGAGAYSDGKLFTRSKKRGPVDKILHILVQHGAKEEILVDAHPHIGTDRLPLVVKAIRETIIACGGKVIFSARVEKLLTDGTHITGAATADGTEYHGPVILATGHSARDVYALLHNAGIELQPKGIAVGVRLEHPQALIDSLQYHCRGKRSQYLPAAEYSLLTRVDGRAVYSFCMCPGGVIVAAATAPGELVVNGMSASARAGRKANSGMVVEVLPEDVPAEFEKFGPLKVMEYQRSIETAFYSDAMSYNSPAQRMTDFVAARDSKNLPESTYAPGIHAARVDLLLPAPISDRLRRGFRDFDSKRRGFLSPEATVIGAETRTSAPVRIPRDKETLQHVSVAGLYPCGEGAGYAGGIVSAAIDGDRCASALAEALKARSF